MTLATFKSYLCISVPINFGMIFIPNSNPFISEKHFMRLYSNFTKIPENREFIVNEQLSFGQGGHKKVILDTQGMAKFAREHNRNFQFY